MKYLIVGLGNIGSEYINTRHNIGFKILDALANASNISFEDRRYAYRAQYNFKGRTFILIKPNIHEFEWESRKLLAATRKTFCR